MYYPFNVSLSNTEYTHGITTSVNSVEVIRPPITASAMGERSAAPSPKPRVRGKRARIVVRLVMIIGRIRRCPASMIASVRESPSFFNWLMILCLISYKYAFFQD